MYLLKTCKTLGLVFVEILEDNELPKQKTLYCLLKSIYLVPGVFFRYCPIKKYFP